MAGGWWEPVRAYCERTGPEVWAEPLNAVSNAAFLVAALVLWREGRGRRDATAAALTGLVAVIGVGSTLFHTLAVRWSMLADVIPIAVFIHAAFLVMVRRLLGLGAVAGVAATLAFAAAAAGFEPALSALAGTPLGPATNGSIDYAPAALALVGVGAAGLAAAPPGRRWAGRALIGLGLVFAASLGARTLDPSLCAAVPVGTHWLWHLLNAVVLYGLVRTARRLGPAGHAT
ncbi:ceramidase domain-containing protein [Methylobacterium oryzihabitans]|uniref:Ceramidase n=1 Tax=Methylobacterium oryzihabitans TaxID=2499852 RepID=A0A3S2VFE9_9HYPH|nr:ceramidase domain-containing protein [Methylobacterium oryzihabitans]RVU21728.1 hypothetical protein EOE48_01390 [Methylobacterium oryzihabitans]